jgi:sec-independent protein translocase protein TatB
MSLELLLILLVALIVFGPQKLPMLASHLGLLMRHLNKLKATTSVFWQQQLNEYQLEENKHKAEEADNHYKN